MSEALARLQERTFAASNAATADSYPAERRFSGDQLAAYLDRRDFAVVSSTRPDGRVHAAVSGFVRREEVFWLPTVAGSVRERNIRTHPWVSLVVTEGDHRGHIAVLLEGPAQIVSPADAPPEVTSMVTGSWISCWIVLQAERLLSYADEHAIPSPPEG